MSQEVVMTYTMGESRDLEAGLEKNPGLKKNQPSGVFWVFLLVFWGFYICAQKREFLGYFQFQLSVDFISFCNILN